MALNLNIPALEEKPIIIADTRPQKISQSLASLQTQDPFEIASYLHIELEILNRQKVSPNSRIQALDSYRPMLMSTVQRLAENYSNAALPLHDKANLAAVAVESLWLELGYGYKLALVDLQNQLIKLGTDKSSAYAIQRAMHAIGEHALVCYQTYISPPNHIWGDLHQLYFCAVQLGIQNASIEAKETGTDSSVSPEVSIENTYKHALLIALADPQHLTQKDIRLAAEFLAHYVGYARMAAITPLESPSAAFIIGLNSNDPPVPYSKQKKAPNPDTDILLQTIDLVRAIHQHLTDLQNNQLPKNDSIPIGANYSDYIDLLTYLIKHWGITPKRVYNRLQKNGQLELVAGISAIHQVSDNNPASINITNKYGDAELSTARAKQVTPSRWQILNISAAGMSIRRHPTAEKNIKIGSLLGIKTKDEHHWSLGLVRWANCGSRDRLDIGVQLIAPQAQSVTARIDGRDYDETLLLLSEVTAENQVATVIAPRGTFVPTRQLIITYNNELKHIMLTRLIERSQHFERIQYSVIS